MFFVTISYIDGSCEKRRFFDRREALEYYYSIESCGDNIVEVTFEKS